MRPQHVRSIEASLDVRNHRRFVIDAKGRDRPRESILEHLHVTMQGHRPSQPAPVRHFLILERTGCALYNGWVRD